MSVLSAVLALLLYAGTLFAVGIISQRRSLTGPLVLGAAIGVYCTSWTFYGAVGTASRTGWDYLPIYLGPILMFSVGLPLVRRVVALGKGHSATSLSDLLSRRFGRSRRLAALVTLTAMIVSIPYIALQLMAVASTFVAVTGRGDGQSPALIGGVALILGAFALVFGTRSRDATKANPGLVGAVAADSVFKLSAFAAVGLTALLSLPDVSPTALALPAADIGWSRFALLTLLSAGAMLCLPRQFHITVVEAASARQLRFAAPLVVVYLAAFALLVLPIASAGRLLSAGGTPDLYVLAVPAALDQDALVLLAFTGGFAAAAGMVIVAGVALSTMVASDIVLPLLARKGGEEAFGSALAVRRGALAGLLAAAAVFAVSAPSGASLAQFGEVSFAGVAQFAPLLVAACFFDRVTERAAFSGLAVGAWLWALLVVGPIFLPGSPGGSPIVSGLAAAFGGDLFVSGTILSLSANILVLIVLTAISTRSLEAREAAARFHAFTPSEASESPILLADLRSLLEPILGAQETDALIAPYGLASERARVPEPLIQAAEAKLSSVLGNASAHILVSRLLQKGRVAAGDVMILMGDASRNLRFGQELLSTTLENLAEGVSVIDRSGRLVAWNRAYGELFGFPPTLLTVGQPVEDLLRHNLPRASEADIRRRVERLKEGRPHTHESRLPDGRIIRLQGRSVPGGGYVTSFSDVTEYRRVENELKESEQSVRFYTDNIPFPIAYCDRDGIVRFHNRAYSAMVGRSGDDVTGESLRALLGEGYALRAKGVANVLRGEGQRFVLGPDETGDGVYWQISYIPQVADDGEVAGFFGFYQDISERRRAQAALEEANRLLERRVEERTAELQHANEELEKARSAAVAANRSKTRFLAAASHDVLQPLNAARLFASALEDDLPENSAGRLTASRIGAAVTSADTLLRSLLNLSKLEAGGVDPKIETFALGPYLRGIVEEFRPLAEREGLKLSFCETTAGTRSDPGLLRSALQNLISNAIRYTDEGGVLVGVRRRGRELSLEVVDTGRGIDEADLPELFREFSRLPRDRDTDGAGLGLATVRRVTDLLGHRVEVRSRLGRGTIFSLQLPVAELPVALERATTRRSGSLSGTRILCVDNDASVLDAMTMRLHRWGADVSACRSLHEVRKAILSENFAPDLLLLDFQLEDGETGLDVHAFLTDLGIDVPGIVITASASDGTEERVHGAGLHLLRKPVEPAVLRALIVSLLPARMGVR